ncbi:hypothetical protein ES703_101440 [subsurface metagenome]
MFPIKLGQFHRHIPSHYFHIKRVHPHMGVAGAVLMVLVMLPTFILKAQAVIYSRQKLHQLHHGDYLRILVGGKHRGEPTVHTLPDAEHQLCLLQSHNVLRYRMISMGARPRGKETGNLHILPSHLPGQVIKGIDCSHHD